MPGQGTRIYPLGGGREEAREVSKSGYGNSKKGKVLSEISGEGEGGWGKEGFGEITYSCEAQRWWMDSQAS